MNISNIESYRLINNKGMSVEFLNLGGIIREINFKGKNRVLKYDRVEDYIDDPHHLGALVGPVAGRISNGSFRIGKKIYNLLKNDKNNSLHGGSGSLTRRLWDVQQVSSNKALLSYFAKDKEGGYPGNREFFVTYSLEDNNELIIEYIVKTDKDTIITLTNHSYFNFNDKFEEDILNHKLYINADRYISLDKENIPKSIKSVENTPFDFRKKKLIGRDLDLSNEDLKYTNGYDHPYILNQGTELSALLQANEVSLEIYTDQPSLVLYTGNGLEKRLGICLETQWYPDAINKEFLEKNILLAGEEYYAKTKYAFR